MHANCESRVSAGCLDSRSHLPCNGKGVSFFALIQGSLLAALRGGSTHDLSPPTKFDPDMRKVEYRQAPHTHADVWSARESRKAGATEPTDEMMVPPNTLGAAERSKVNRGARRLSMKGIVLSVTALAHISSFGAIAAAQMQTPDCLACPVRFLHNPNPNTRLRPRSPAHPRLTRRSRSSTGSFLSSRSLRT
jgi:hypothetical protein